MKASNVILTGILGISLVFTNASSYFTNVEQENASKATMTTYVDEEGKQKTIYWTNQITPPKMGGVDSDFEKKETVEANGARYVEYVTPYQAGHGWYDVNKTPDQAQDAFLCFSAAAANMLHWWFDQNQESIQTYLEKYPNAPKANDIIDMQSKLTSQQGSKIYQRFVNQFANRKKGFWPDLLQDQFINGYRPKENGGVTDPSFEGASLIQNGPDARGGFFYDVFGINILTQRRYYDFLNNYQHVSNDLKQFLTEGKMVTLTYDMRTRAHVVTIWGAEFDQKGNLTGIYFSDSDDVDGYGMRRYRVMNKNGNAYVTTDMRENGGGSLITTLTTLDAGKKTWNEFLHQSPIELQLKWDHSSLVYNGSIQKPNVYATNISDGDDVTVSAIGGGTNVGTYTATAQLNGTDSNRYSLPVNHQIQFSILPSGTIFKGGIKTYLDTTPTSQFNWNDTIIIKITPKATGKLPNSKKKGITSISPTNGKMSLYLEDVQLVAPISIDEQGVYTFVYSIENGALKKGENVLTLKFFGDQNLADYEENVTVIVKERKDTYVPALEPTCETDGMKAHYIGENGKYYIEENGNKVEVKKEDLIIKAFGHRLSDWIQENDHHYKECLNGCGNHFEEEACFGGEASLEEAARCDVCGNHYGKPLEKPPVIQPQYEIINGNHQVYELGQSKPLLFVLNQKINQLLEIKIDGIHLDSNNYQILSNDQKILIFAEYLETLSQGNHIIEMIFENEAVIGEFQIKNSGIIDKPDQNSNQIETNKEENNYQDNTPNTGYTDATLMWLIFMGMSSCILFLNRKKI